MASSLRCVVFGGNGFLGSHLVHSLLSHGYFVRSFDLPTSKSLDIANENFEFFAGSWLNKNDVAEALRDCDICYHLISTTLPNTSNKDIIYDIESNLACTINMLHAARKTDIKKVIFASSGGTVYGIPNYVPIDEGHPTNPICSYGITKLAIEKYLHLFYKLFGLDYSILRFANPFGEGQRIHSTQGAIAVFIGKVLEDSVIEIWGDGSVVRDYVHISDVVSALLVASQSHHNEKIFNIGSGTGLSINEVLNAIESVSGKKTKRRYLDSRNFDVKSNILSISLAKNVLGWTPKKTFEEGLRHFIEWAEKSK